MSPLYIYNGKLLVKDAKLASSPSCCCCPSLVEIIHVVRDQWTVAAANCGNNPQPLWETNVVIPDQFPVPTQINIRGNVNDDLLLNGQSITTGWQYDPGPYESFIPGCVGAHNIGEKPGNFKDLVNGGITIPMGQRTFTIGLVDTVGFGAGWDITISVCCNPDQNSCESGVINSCCIEHMIGPEPYYECESGTHITEETCDGIFKPNQACSQNLCPPPPPPKGTCCIDGVCKGFISESECDAHTGTDKVWIEGEDNCDLCSTCCCNGLFPYTTTPNICTNNNHTQLMASNCWEYQCSLSFTTEASDPLGGWSITEIPDTSPQQYLYETGPFTCDIIEFIVIPTNNHTSFIPLDWPDGVEILTTNIVGPCNNQLP